MLFRSPTVVETLRVAAPPPSNSPANPTRQSTRQNNTPRQQQPVQQSTAAPQNPEPPPQAAGNGRVLVSAGACDAEIFVDGNRIGSRRASVQVTAGTAHTVRVVPETGAAWTSSVTVANGETKNVVAQGITCGNE